MLHRVVVMIVATLLVGVVSAQAEEHASAIRVWEESAGSAFPRFIAAMRHNGWADETSINTEALGYTAYQFAEANGHLELVPKTNQGPETYAAMFRRWNGVADVEKISIEAFRTKGQVVGWWLPVKVSGAASVAESQPRFNLARMQEALSSLRERVASGSTSVSKLETEIAFLKEELDLLRELGTSVTNQFGSLKEAIDAVAASVLAFQDGKLTPAMEKSVEELLRSALAEVDKKIDTATEGFVTDTGLAREMEGLATDDDVTEIHKFLGFFAKLMGGIGLAALAFVVGWLLWLGSRQRQIEQDLVLHGQSPHKDEEVVDRVKELEERAVRTSETLAGTHKLACKALEEAEEAGDIAIEAILSIGEDEDFFVENLPPQAEIEERLDKEGKVLVVWVLGKVVTFTREDNPFNDGRPGLRIRGLGPERDARPISLEKARGRILRVCRKARKAGTIVGTDNPSGNGDNGQGDQKAA